MKASKEAVFLGAVVKYKKEDWYVVKINAKTAYIAQDKNFLEKWKENNVRTWKEFCRINKAVMTNYDGFTIDKAEAEKKTVVEEKAERRKKERRYLPKSEEAELREIWDRIEKTEKDKGNKRKKHKYMKTFRYITKYGRGQYYYAISKSFENKFILFNINGRHVFYDVLDDKYVLFKQELHKNGKEIVWPARDAISA